MNDENNTPEFQFPVKQSEAIYWWTESSILHFEKRREVRSGELGGIRRERLVLPALVLGLKKEGQVYVNKSRVCFSW